MMYHIGLGFTGTPRPLNGRHITPRGLHGLLYHVLGETNQQTADWLHSHPAPKPYTLVPYYEDGKGVLAGLRLSALTEQSAELLLAGWEAVRCSGRELHLGRQAFVVERVSCIPGPTYEELTMCEPGRELTLNFLSPTLFRQGNNNLCLPMPRNVFYRPFTVWQSFAPSAVRRLPGDWLAWCEQHVTVQQHSIHTVPVAINKKAAGYTGFVGEVSFKAYDDTLLYLSVWQGLTHLLAYCGTGWKTTMGLGIVERVNR